MTAYEYIAYADNGTHNTQYGLVEAATPREAEKKVKESYSYNVSVSLAEQATSLGLNLSGKGGSVKVMNRGVLI